MKEAEERGLVNFVWDEAELEGNLRNMIAELTALPMETVPQFKHLVNTSIYGGLDLHLDRERFSVSQLGNKEQFRTRLDKRLREK